MLTTVCDTCGTEFRVTPEQLKLREGRVRCGKCSAIFNALITLTVQENREPPALATVNPAEPAVEPVVVSTTGIAFATTSMPAASIPATLSPAEVLPEAQPADSALTWPTIDPVVLPAAELPPAPAPAAVLVAMPTALPKTREEPARDTVANPAVAPQEFDFGPKAPVRRSRWWIPLATLLLLGFIAQAAFYFRGAIAFILPETKPFITEFCAELGCEVPLPRRSELISIETSDLQADPTNPGIIVLLATLRNRAAFPQTFPALELTLTNERDQPLARRVLYAGDYLTDKSEAFEGSSEKQVRLNIEAGSLKATGYRLYLFYP
jgi:predicted Zn finger-like uncharacterized protein